MRNDPGRPVHRIISKISIIGIDDGPELIRAPGIGSQPQTGGAAIFVHNGIRHDGSTSSPPEDLDTHFTFWRIDQQTTYAGVLCDNVSRTIDLLVCQYFPGSRQGATGWWCQDDVRLAVQHTAGEEECWKQKEYGKRYLHIINITIPGKALFDSFFKSGILAG
jgi:hypothetical protein